MTLAYERRLNNGLGARLVFGWDDYDDDVLTFFNNSDKFVRIELMRRF
jgi:hypothetical protein